MIGLCTALLGIIIVGSGIVFWKMFDKLNKMKKEFVDREENLYKDLIEENKLTIEALNNIKSEMDSNFIKSQTSYDEIYDALNRFTEDIRKIYEVWNNSDYLRRLKEELALYIEHLQALSEYHLYQGDTHLKELLLQAKDLMSTIDDFLKMVEKTDNE